jgi:leucyl-tRNA synthetase
VARLYELAGAMTDAEREAAAATDDSALSAARIEALEMVIRLTAPMMPHLAEAMNALLYPDNHQLIANESWPGFDESLTAAETVTIAVQVMGKLRGTVEFPPGSPADAVIAAAEAEPNVARLLEGKRVVKKVHVPDRIVNFVIAG